MGNNILSYSPKFSVESSVYIVYMWPVLTVFSLFLVNFLWHSACMVTWWQNCLPVSVVSSMSTYKKVPILIYMVHKVNSLLRAPGAQTVLEGDALIVRILQYFNLVRCLRLRRWQPCKRYGWRHAKRSLMSWAVKPKEGRACVSYQKDDGHWEH